MEKNNEQQLEFHLGEEFSLRLSIAEAMRLFWENYWCHLPFGSKSHAHRKRILNFFKNYYIDSISKADVEKFRRHMTEMGYGLSTINKTHMMLARLYSKLEEYKEGKFLNGLDLSRLILPIKNPAGQVSRPNERHLARKLEITKERKKILCSYSDEDLCEIIDGLYWSMLRQGDFFSITSDNVDIKRRLIIGVQKKTITLRYQSLPYKVIIPESRVEMIKRRIDRTKPGTPIFRKTNLQKRWEVVRKLASRIDPVLAKAQLRDIRGGATSYLLDNSIDLETVRKKGGWASVEMIPRYDKRGEEPLRVASEKLVET